MTATFRPPPDRTPLQLATETSTRLPIVESLPAATFARHRADDLFRINQGFGVGSDDEIQLNRNTVSNRVSDDQILSDFTRWSG
ncbi:MAG TPA: hypothetical protein DDZ51_02860 [Planctomycetaceae bacterium]|nr:hypothetical protein [Planctomycetaceae bacterium]